MMTVRQWILEENMVSRPVRNLQYMLRRLSIRYPDLPELQPDGLFGERTLEAVMRFQKQMGIPVTGVVDPRLWHAIRDEWLSVEHELAHPRKLRGYPEKVTTQPGERGDHLYVVQAMFRALSPFLEGWRTKRSEIGTMTRR